MIHKIIFSLAFLSLTGCSCTSCLFSEVGDLYQQERRNAQSIKPYTMDLVQDEFLAIKGATKDVTRGFDRESYNPTDYFDDLSEIFCPCP